MFCTQGEKSVQTIHASILSEGGGDGFQCPGKGFHGKAFPACLLLSSNFDGQRGAHVDGPATCNNRVFLHSKRRGTQRIVQAAYALFHCNTVAAAHIKGHKTCLLRNVKEEALSSPVHSFAGFNGK